MASYRNQIFSFIVIGFLAFIVTTRFTFEARRILDFEIETCPFCFSRTLCESLPKVRIKISLIEFIVSYFNRKYVFFGSYGNRSVVLKRLAFEHEIHNLDALVANTPIRDVLVDENHFFKMSSALLNQSFSRSDSKLSLCPTLSNVNLLFERMRSQDQLSFLNIWTSLQLNPEPLILQAFTSEEGWSVPKYIGACGRVIIVENSGKPVSAYRNHPWLFRAHIVEQLLSMAYNFTFSNLDFGIYLKDISPENVVIDEKMKPRLVDLEHLIIVDKNTPPKNQPDAWHSVHKSEHFHCDNCLSYSPSSICSHRISDHNLYAVCQEFLSSEDLGLLHSGSGLDYVAKNMEKLKFHIDECIRPSTNTSRFEIVEAFTLLLREVKVAGNFNLNECKKLL